MVYTGDHFNSCIASPRIAKIVPSQMPGASGIPPRRSRTDRHEEKDAERQFQQEHCLMRMEGQQTQAIAGPCPLKCFYGGGPKKQKRLVPLPEPGLASAPAKRPCIVNDEGSTAAPESTPTGVCGKHGGGPRCVVANCSSLARGASGKCSKHGGGPRCGEAN